MSIPINQKCMQENCDKPAQIQIGELYKCKKCAKSENRKQFTRITVHWVEMRNYLIPKNSPMVNGDFHSEEAHKYVQQHYNMDMGAFLITATSKKDSRDFEVVEVEDED